MKNILIIKPSSFGDIVQALPVAARLKECAEEARISWLVNARYERLLDLNPAVDRVIVFRRDLWKRAGSLGEACIELASLARDLGRARFDTVLDLQGLLRSGIFSFLTGAPVRAGFVSAREFAHLFYTLKVATESGEMHAVDRYLLLSDAIGCARGEIRFPLGERPEDERWAEELLSAGGRAPRVGLVCSARWLTKRWPAERFASLGDRLADRGALVVVVGGPEGEGAEAAALMRARAVKALGITDPLRLASLLRALDVAVTNDSGPMHLAAAVGTPVVALFGPTNPRLTGPYGPGHTIITAEIGCRPCYRRGCDRAVECMTIIDVGRVQAAVENVIASAAE